MLLCGRLCLAGGFPYVRRRGRPDLDPELQRDPGRGADGDAVHPGGGGPGVGGAVGAEHAGSQPPRCACRSSGAPPCMRPGSNGRGRSRPPASIGRPPPVPPPPHPPTDRLSCGAARSSRRATATATRPSPRRGSAGRDRCTSSRWRQPNE